MPFINRPAKLEWTLHARAKMNHYRLSPARVRHVLHSPKRIEEGVAPKTVAMMQPASLKTTGSRVAGAGGRMGMGSGRFATSPASTARQESWTQEIWVMVQDAAGTRKVISAWRYPGVTKPRDAAFLKKEYGEFLAAE